MNKLKIAIIILINCLFSSEEHSINLHWDISDKIKLLKESPLLQSSSSSSTIISFPYPNRAMKQFYMYKTNVMPQILADKYSQIETFSGIGVNNPSELVSLTIYNNEAIAMIHSDDGNIYINNYSSELYRVSYNELGFDNKHFNCENEIFNKNSLNRSGQFDECIGEDIPCYTMGDKLITYRIAMIMTEAVTNSVADGTVEGAMAWIASMVNQLNLLWRRELGFQFELIPNNDILVFTDNNPVPKGEDGFGDTNPAMYCTNSDPKYCEINNVEPYLESVIGIGGFDAPDDSRLWEYGLVLHTTYNGGVAQAPGPISANNPTYEVLNHELGHNLGSAHNISIENGYRCTLGGTIMGSRVRTSPGSIGDQYSLHTIEIGFKNYNTLPNNPAYGDSYAYLRGYLSSETNINIPELNVPLSGFTIPKETPFVLEGSSIQENPSYLYSWEQNDASSISFCMDQTNSSAECDGLSAWPSSEGPLFSTVDLSPNGNKRYFPSMSSLLNNEYTTTYDDYGTILTVERLPFGSRDINMRFQIRTNEITGGAVNFKNVQFSVDDNSGPFRITSQLEATNWTSQSSQIITWDVANTNVSPVNCLNVDILLSFDAGRNFNIILADDVPNNGLYEVLLPPMANSDSCRIMVKSSDNIFFDINNAYISITNINIPNISLNESSINFELPSDSQYETGLLLTNSGEVGSVLSYNINFIDSIYIDEDFEGLDLNDSLVTTEYILPADWSRSSNGRGWIIGTEETSAWPFDMADFYFDIPEWEDGNYAYTDDGQYNICPSCTPSLDCYSVNGCSDGSLDYLLMPLLSIPSSSMPKLSFDTFSFYENYFDHNNILQIKIDNDWTDIEILDHNQNEFVNKKYDLIEYSGKEIQVRFHSSSGEPAVWNAGWAIDNVLLKTSPLWIFSTERNGTIIAGESITIPLTINTNGLVVGDIYKTKIVISDQINNVSDTIDVNLQILSDEDLCGSNVGDLNNDGGWNILDIVTLALCVLVENCNTLQHGCAADVNSDGGFNILDIVQLSNCIVIQGC